MRLDSTSKSLKALWQERELANVNRESALLQAKNNLMKMQGEASTLNPSPTSATFQPKPTIPSEIRAAMRSGTAPTISPAQKMREEADVLKARMELDDTKIKFEQKNAGRNRMGSMGSDDSAKLLNSYYRQR